MRKHRKLLIVAVLVVVCGGAVAFLLLQRLTLPPQAARLLPEGDRLAYINLKMARPFWDLSKSGPVELEGDYQNFVNQTGIQFERDLDEVAASWQGGGSTGAGEYESAAVFVGRFDAAKLKSYLQKASSQTESYRDLKIYSVPNGDHIVQACILNGSQVAVTARSPSEIMHGIIDRTRGSPRGPQLLQAYYRRVPSRSLAWMIDRIRNRSPQAGGLSFSFLENTDVVASLRYGGSLLARADIFTASPSDAKHVLDSANTFLAVYRSLTRNFAKGGDTDVKAAIESIRAEQHDNVVTVSAVASEQLLKKLQVEGNIKTTAPRPPAPEARPVTPVRRR